MIYQFKFWDPVYYKSSESREGIHFPSQPNEEKGKFVGFSESVGHMMTYKILSDSTNRILYRSRIRLESEETNKRLDKEFDPNIAFQIDNESDIPNVVKTKKDEGQLVIIDVDDIIGRTYLRE